jgi:hypothetical protein
MMPTSFTGYLATYSFGPFDDVSPKQLGPQPSHCFGLATQCRQLMRTCERAWDQSCARCSSRPYQTHSVALVTALTKVRSSCSLREFLQRAPCGRDERPPRENAASSTGPPASERPLAAGRRSIPPPLTPTIMARNAIPDPPIEKRSLGGSFRTKRRSIPDRGPLQPIEQFRQGCLQTYTGRRSRPCLAGEGYHLEGLGLRL